MRGIFSARAGGIAALIALLATVLAGATAPAAAPLDPGLTAFLAAGGSLDDICDGGGHGHGHDGGASHCDACRLLGPAILPEPPRVAALSFVLGARVAPHAAPVPPVVPLGAGRPRAPPPVS